MSTTTMRPLDAARTALPVHDHHVEGDADVEGRPWTTMPTLSPTSTRSQCRSTSLRHRRGVGGQADQRRAALAGKNIRRCNRFCLTSRAQWRLLLWRYPLRGAAFATILSGCEVPDGRIAKGVYARTGPVHAAPRPDLAILVVASAEPFPETCSYPWLALGYEQHLSVSASRRSSPHARLGGAVARSYDRCKCE